MKMILFTFSFLLKWEADWVFLDFYRVTEWSEQAAALRDVSRGSRHQKGMQPWIQGKMQKSPQLEVAGPNF